MQKHVYIIDFDDTIWQRASWMKELERAGRIENANEVLKSLDEFKLIKNEYSATHATLKKHNIRLDADDIRIVQDFMKSRIDKRMKQIIKNLQMQGHEVFVIGGGVYGCAFISGAVSDMDIKPENIFSGYFKNFSEREIDKVLNSGYKYYNCRNPNLFTPDTHKKSDFVRLLKDSKRIPATAKVINIGDGLNDLEIFKAKESEIFIGFGVYKQHEQVKQNATHFVSSFEELKRILSLIAED